MIQEGLKTVKKILAENYVRPDEAEKVKSTIRERGSLKVIDKVTVTLNEKRDVYEALLGNLGVKGVEVASGYRQEVREAAGRRHLVHRHPGVFLRGGPEGLAVRAPGLEADPDAEHGHGGVVPGAAGLHRGAVDRRAAPFDRHGADELQRAGEVAPAGPHDPAGREQLQPAANLALVAPARATSTRRSARTASWSPAARRPWRTCSTTWPGVRSGLVGLWDVVAFDEVAGITFKDKDGVQIMKDYMASGSFARGRDAINAYASMVFVGNINQPVDTLVKTSHLFAPFPETMIDSAFFDRFHAYIPGWEIPKMRPEFFTNQYGLIVDYLAEWLREMRKRNFGDAINKYFKLGRDLNQRDTIAVKHTVSGLLKLLYPNEEYDKDAVRRCLEYALEARRRVKEQLKKIGGMEFFDVHFSYIDLETMEEKFISVPEQGGGSLIPDGPLSPGVMHTVATGGRASRPVPTRNPGDVRQRHAEDIGPRLQLCGEGSDQGRLRLLQGERPPGQRFDQGLGTTTTTFTSSNCTTRGRRPP